MAICFVNEQRYADIEFLNSGEILAVTYTGVAEPNVWEINDGILDDAIERIHTHVAP